MASNEELLDILLQIRATGQAEAESVNAILANTGNVATGTATQLSSLTQVEKEHVGVLQTASTFHANYGGQLTAQEASYARLQLSGMSVARAERDVAAEANAAARAAGALGEQGARAFDRMSALGGVMASGGLFSLGVGAAIVGGGAVVEMGKSMIDNADQNEAAQRNLSQAFGSQGRQLSLQQDNIDAWITQNARFLSSEYEAKNSIASITRAGNDWTTTQRILNDALDLSVAKNISLSDATKVLLDAEQGRSMGLLELGISIKKIDDPVKELAKANKEVASSTSEHTRAVRELAIWEDNHSDRAYLTRADLIREQMLKDNVKESTKKLTTANQDLATATALAKDKGSQFNQVLDQLEGKTAGARNDTSDLKQSEHELGITWQKLSDDDGPALEGMLAGVLKGTDDLLNAMKSSDWGGVDQPLVFLAGKWHDLTIEISDATNAYEAWLIANGITTAAGEKTPGGGKFGTFRDPGHPSGNVPQPPPNNARATTQGQSGRSERVSVDITVKADPGTTARAIRRAMQV